jgi:hypothetical protein
VWSRSCSCILRWIQLFASERARESRAFPLFPIPPCFPSIRHPYIDLSLLIVFKHHQPAGIKIEFLRFRSVRARA